MRIRRYPLQGDKFPAPTVYMVGLFVGMLLMNFGKSIFLDNAGFLSEDTLYHMKYITVDRNALFCYVLLQRIGRVLILVILTTTYLGIFVCYGAVLWYGMGMGAFLAAAVIRYGVKGIMFVTVSMFPHYLLYIPAMVWLLFQCMALYRSIYLDKTFPGNRNKNVPIKKLLQFLGTIAAFLLGCALESYVNPSLMSGLLRVF